MKGLAPLADAPAVAYRACMMEFRGVTGRDTRVVAGVAALVIGIALIGSAVLDLGEDSRTVDRGAGDARGLAAGLGLAATVRGADHRPARKPIRATLVVGGDGTGPSLDPGPVHARRRVHQRADPGHPRCRCGHPGRDPPPRDDRALRDRCLPRAARRLGDPTFDIVVHGVGSPEPWDYTTDGVTTTILDALDVDTR